MDADGQRVIKTTAAQTTTYLEGLYEKRTNAGGVIEHVYYIGNEQKVVAQLTLTDDGMSTQSDFVYTRSDHLGSAELLTHEDGSIVARRSYSPFGTRRDPDNWLFAPSSYDGAAVRLSFTGHEADDEYGLTHMVGRHYDPRIGRFLSPDPTPGFSSRA